MKQLTTYNRAAGYLNRIFDLLNEAYFVQDMMPVIKRALTSHGLSFTLPQLKMVGHTLSQEYFHERNWAQ